MPLNEAQIKTLITLQAMTFSKILYGAGCMRNDHVSAAALKLLAFCVERSHDGRAKGQTLLELAMASREDVDLEIEFIYAEYKDKIKIP